jgi:hypothetical protein
LKPGIPGVKIKNMIASSGDLLVRNEDDFWRLPEDGLWEVVATEIFRLAIRRSW